PKDSLGNRDGRDARDLQPSQIKWYGRKRSGPVIDQMPRSQKATRITPRHQDSKLLSVESQHFNLALIPPQAAGGSEENGLTIWKDLGVAMAIFAFAGVRSRQDLRVASSGGNSPETGVTRRVEDNGVVRCPACTTADAGIANRLRCAAADRNLLHLAL